MTTHPKFNNDSSCHNCAAFVPNVEGHPERGGSCHRHAPRPTHAWVKHFAGEDDERPSESDTSSEIVWPVVDDVFFCCEWLPAFRTTGEARS
jgi:hypothetical protein